MATRRHRNLIVLVVALQCCAGLVKADDWAQLSTGGGPSARWDAAAAWDAGGARLVVFGGSDSTGVWKNDTWTFDPGTQSWTELAVTGQVPGERYRHICVYDPVRGRLIVHGGWESSGDEVWALSLTGVATWSQLAVGGPGPSSRFGHIGIYDPQGDRLIIHGGDQNFAYRSGLRDTWAFSFATGQWTQLASTAPGPTTDGVGFYDAVTKEFIRTGGREYVGGDCAPLVSSASGSTFRLPLNPLGVWTSVTTGGTAPVRSDMGGVFDHLARRAVVFGGVSRSDCVSGCSAPTEAKLDGTFQLSVDGSPAWAAVSTGMSPGARGHAAVAYDPLGHRMFLFGGGDYVRTVGANCNDVSRECTYHRDLWVFQMSPAVSVPPPGSGGPSLIPSTFSLRQNQPNPFTGTTMIAFDLPREVDVRLDVFDAQARLIRTLYHGGLAAGSHAVEWDHRDGRGRTMGPGMYLYRIHAGTFRDQKKMVLLPR